MTGKSPLKDEKAFLRAVGKPLATFEFAFYRPSEPAIRVGSLSRMGSHLNGRTSLYPVK